MRKYENVDVIAVLGAVMEINTEHYKSDFNYDMKMFDKAARNPDGENNHLLWLSRQSGTECFIEREVYLKNTQANYAWNYHASTHDTIRAYAVEIKGMVAGRIMGDITEIDCKTQVLELKKHALSIATVSLKFKDGTEMRMTYADFDKNSQSLIHEHGRLTSMRREPEDEDVLRQTLLTARKWRDEESHPAVFKVRVQHLRPSIREQLATDKQQLSQKRAAAPQKAAAKSNELEV